MEKFIQLDDGTVLQYDINTQCYYVVDVEIQDELQDVTSINNSSVSVDQPSRTMPKDNSVVGSVTEGCKTDQQTSSVIPMSSGTASSSSRGSCGTPTIAASSIGFNYDSPCESLKLITNRSTTLNSQCSQGSSSEIGIKIWNYKTTTAFISLVEKHEDAFKKQMKKKVWNNIAFILSETLKINVTGQQCDTKWKGLVDMYKKIKKHNDTSGNERKDWEFWDKMDAILFKRPEISPVATCSSYNGLLENNQERRDYTEGLNNRQHTDSTDGTPNSQGNEENVLKTSNSKFTSRMGKRKCRIDNPTERRHKEKLARQDRFLDLFEKYLERQK